MYHLSTHSREGDLGHVAAQRAVTSCRGSALGRASGVQKAGPWPPPHENETSEPSRSAIDQNRPTRVYCMAMIYLTGDAADSGSGIFVRLSSTKTLPWLSPSPSPLCSSPSHRPPTPGKLSAVFRGAFWALRRPRGRSSAARRTAPRRRWHILFRALGRRADPRGVLRTTQLAGGHHDELPRRLRHRAVHAGQARWRL